MPMNAKVTINDALIPAFRAGERAGAQAVADRVLELSDARVPVDTGKLRLSGHTTPDLALTAAVVVSYEEFYAIWQEENLTYHHEHGQAKFLETALADVEPEGDALIAEQIRAHLAL